MTKPSNLVFAPEDLIPYLPSSLPLLRAQDICYRQSSRRVGKSHNLHTWLAIITDDAMRKSIVENRLGPGYPERIILKHVVECSIVLECKRSGLKTLKDLPLRGISDLSMFNIERNSKARLASAWNRGIERLGYDNIVDC